MKQSTQWIILLRHGIAEERGPDIPDDERTLTAKGRRRMRRSARGLAQLLPPIDIIASSPLRRCVETAHFVAARSDVSEVELLDELRPDADPQEFLRCLRQTNPPTAVYVGHEPLLSGLACSLLGIDRVVGFELRKGGCYIFTTDDGKFRLQWLLAPRVLRSVR